MSRHAEPKHPVVRFPHVVEGFGKLYSPLESRAVSHFSLSRDLFDDSMAWKFEFRVPASESEQWDVSELIMSRKVCFEGITNRGEEVRVSDFLVHSTNRYARKAVESLASASAFEFDLIEGDPLPVVSRRRVVVRYSPTKLSRRDSRRIEFELRGERQLGRTDASLTIGMDCGSFILKSELRFDLIETKSETATVVMQPFCLIGDWAKIEVQQTAEDFLNKSAQQLNHLGLILSFLSRTRVDWTHAEVYDLDKVSKKHRNVRRMRQIRGYPRNEATPLIETRSCSPQAIDIMLKAFETSKFSEVIGRVINYLLSAKNPTHSLEERMSAAFTAMEALTFAVLEARGDPPLMTESVYGQFAKTVKKSIKEFSSTQSWDEDVRKALYSKIIELRRPPITPRIVEVFLAAGIEWQSYWTDEQDFIAYLKSAYNRRSELIHTGIVTDGHTAMDDVETVHALTEMLLYRLLGGQKDWRAGGAYSTLGYVRKRSKERDKQSGHTENEESGNAD